MENKAIHKHYARTIKGTWVEGGLCKKCSEYLKGVLDERNKEKLAVIMDNRRYTDKDSDKDILLAINMLAGETMIRSIDEYEKLGWERFKLKEIERLSGILAKRKQYSTRRCFKPKQVFEE